MLPPGQCLRCDCGVASRLRAGDANVAGVAVLFCAQQASFPAESFTRHLDHVHWATTRGHDYPELMVLAIDHRSQFEDPANFGTADSERIANLQDPGVACVACRRRS